MGIIETIKMMTREEALKEGRKEEKTSIINNLLLNTDFDTAKIANLTGASEAFVKRIQKSIKVK